MPQDPLTLPADAAAQAALAAEGLRYGLVDPRDEAQVRAWIEADARGFHEPLQSDEQAAFFAPDLLGTRTVAVWDETAALPDQPVATTTSWPALTTLPGGEVTAWAISSVTVAPTHRRRGIARAVLEAELRAAGAAGLPLAVLTVSETTIYSRYGFGPAASVASYEIDARRAGWLGGDVPGRLQLVDRDAAMAAAGTVLPAARRGTVGDVEVVGHRFERLFGSPADPPDLRSRRFVRYDDEAGRPRGIAVYSVTEDPTDFAGHTVDVRHLATTSDDAYRAIWRFLLELDLVRTVRAQLRSTDEPLRWLLRDQRALRTTAVREHLWARVLDPVAAFGARTYSAPGTVGLRVADPLGYAEGEWLLTAQTGGSGRLQAAAAPEGTPALDVPVDLLGPLLLGGVSAVTLAAAGRIAERASGDAVAADRVLRAPVVPTLATWF